MQPFDARRSIQPSPAPPPAPFADDEETFDLEAAPATVVSAPLRLAAPAVLVEARFRGITLTSRLLRADEPRTFTIGSARGTDAPVNPAWLPDGDDPLAPRRHTLLEPVPGGFVLNLTAPMRPRLRTEHQDLPLAPDAGRAEAPLSLPPGSALHVPCGEVTFDLHPAEPAAAVPRPWLPARWQAAAIYPLAVALAIGLLMLVVHLVPADPRALSLDTIDSSHRIAAALVIPLEVNAPEIDRARDLQKIPGGGGAPAAAKPSGQAGDRLARTSGHLTIKGDARPEDARSLAARIRKNSILAMLDGPPASALEAVLDDGPAMGADAETVMGNLIATNAGPGYGVGGLGVVGSGAGGGGQGEGTIGLGTIGTLGKFGRGSGSGPGYGIGTGVGTLHAHHTITPDPILGIGHVTGALDKEIIRRIVRRHMNEVKFCYEQSLTKRPRLAGRIVTQFSIAPTGRVLAAVIQSSTLGVVAVDSCVVDAIKRWEFPAPTGGGLAMVSYPFNFAPAGGE